MFGGFRVKKRSNFFIRRLHSLVGLIPVGIFLCVHLLLNSTALAGPNFYANVTIAGMRGIPFIIIAELLLIAIPIIFHAAYGIYIVYMAKNNVLRYTYARNWMFYLQRITAIITTIFVMFHVLTLRIFTDGVSDTLVSFVYVLQNPLGLFLYCVCVVAAIFHFSNGLFTLLITWGIIQGPRVQKIFTYITMAIFVFLSILSIIILVAIANYRIIF